MIDTPTGHDDKSIINRTRARMNTKSGMQINQGNHLEVSDSEFEENGEHGVDITERRQPKTRYSIAATSYGIPGMD